MPRFAPRTEPVKKKDELLKREQELRHVLQKNVVIEKLVKVAERYRKAQISLLKATIHVIKEKEFGKRSHNLKIESVEAQIKTWTDKTNEQIIDEFKQSLTKNSSESN